MEMEQFNYEKLGLVELCSTEIVSLNGGWVTFGREVFRVVLIDLFVKYAKESGQAWMDFIQGNPHLFPDGPPDNSGAPY